MLDEKFIANEDLVYPLCLELEKLGKGSYTTESVATDLCKRLIKWHMRTVESENAVCDEK